MSSHELLINGAAAVVVGGLMAYMVLGGADFGGGVWDLFARGPRRREQRHAIAHATGPVWEANHVWLIFVLVTLFTCFPRGYAALSVALFVPFHLALLGIMLRGAAFVFRAHGWKAAPTTSRPRRVVLWIVNPANWQLIFGVSSLITPFLLGASFGALTEGGVRVSAEGHVWTDPSRPIPWLSFYAIACGLLAVSASAYLAAVYLVGETKGELRDDFRRNAIFAGTTTAMLSGVVLFTARSEARWFYDRLLTHETLLVFAGLICFALSAYAVFFHRYRLAPIFAAGEIVLLLAGWAMAHRPYLIYPDVTLADAAGPPETIRFLLWTLPFGLALLLPSLWMLFHVFKKSMFVPHAEI